mgnify:CR=1 FL=1
MVKVVITYVVESLVLGLKSKDVIRALSPRLVGVTVDVLQNVGDSSLESRLLVLVGVEVVVVAAAAPVSVPIASQRRKGHHGNVELDAVLVCLHHEVI